MANNIIDKWDDYVAERRGESKQQTLDDSTLISRKKKGNKNRLRRKFARVSRRNNKTI